MSYLVFCGLLPTCLSVFFYILNGPTFLHCGFGRAVCMCVFKVVLSSCVCWAGRELLDMSLLVTQCFFVMVSLRESHCVFWCVYWLSGSCVHSSPDLNKSWLRWDRSCSTRKWEWRPYRSELNWVKLFLTHLYTHRLRHAMCSATALWGEVFYFLFKRSDFCLADDN